MKIKNTVLLVILLLGLLPIGSASAGSPAEGSLDGSIALLFASRSILLGDVDLEGANRSQGALMSVSLQESNQADEALAHLIHATKQQRNELNDSCRTLTAAYRAEGKTCEQQILDDYCKAEEAKLNQRLGLLHKLRGDRRKAFTRIWHSLKRSGNRVWTAVGPVGRRILRNVGSEAAEVVLSGGNLSSGVIRKLFIKEARNIGEAELNRLLERGVGRFLEGQAALAVAAGVSDCTEEKLDQARQQVAGDVGEPVAEDSGNEPESMNTQPQVSFTGQLSLICDQWVGDAGDSEGMAKLPMNVNFDSGEFYGEGSYSYVKENAKTSTSTFVYQGIVSQEGILIGTFNLTTTVDNVDVGFVGGSLTALGIITEDGRGLYLYNYQESNTEMLELFENGREAVLNDRAQFMNTPDNPPTCR